VRGGGGGGGLEEGGCTKEVFAIYTTHLYSGVLKGVHYMLDRE